jgi:hypothetical protein
MGLITRAISSGPGQATDGHDLYTILCDIYYDLEALKTAFDAHVHGEGGASTTASPELNIQRRDDE